jgi:hypothetical protein
MNLCLKILIFILGYLLTLAIIIANACFSGYYVLYEFENDPFIKEIDTNLNNKLINSLTFRSFCKDDEEKLILGTWDGNSAGCDCEGIIYDEKCSKKKIESGCNNIFANDPFNFTVFNSNFICVKRTKLNYRDYLKSNKIVSKNKGCPTNHKSCGILDTLGRKLCVPKEETCPLNSITFAQQNLTFNETESNSNDEGLLLVTINLFQYLPCANFSEKFWNYYYSLEPKDKRCTTTINGKLYDERYVKFDNYSVNKLELYNDNLITKKLTKISEENLNKMKNDNIYLFGRNYFGFDDNTIENFDYDALISKQNTSNDWMLYNAIFVILIIIGTFGSYVLGFVAKLGPECCVLKIKRIKKCLTNIAFFCYYISNIFIFIANLKIFLNTKNIKSILNINGDEISNEFIKKLIEKYSINYKFSLALVIIAPFIFVVFVWATCIFFCEISVLLEENQNNKNKDKNDETRLVPSTKDDDDNDEDEDKTKNDEDEY